MESGAHGYATHSHLMPNYGTHFLHGFHPHFLQDTLRRASLPLFPSNGVWVSPFALSTGLEAAKEATRTPESSSSRSMSPREDSMDVDTSEDGDQRNGTQSPERSAETPGFRRK